MKNSLFLMAIAAILFAAGLATRPRMNADWDKLAVSLNLNENQHGILNNPVGFEAKGK